MPIFGYKNHLGIDRAHGFIRRFVVTDAARHDGAQLGAVLDPGNTGSGVWADTAYRSKANRDLLDRRGLRAEFQRAKPRGRPMPAHIARGNATRARVRSLVEHVFAAERRRMGLVSRCIGLARHGADHAGEPGLQHAPTGVDRAARCARLTDPGAENAS
ncbi:transposase, partial [Benzoatithermus flavus]